MKNVDDESYCPEVKRVFDNKGAAIIDYCKKARNEIPEERPTDKYKKLFKFPMLTLDRNVVKSDEIFKYGEVEISEWCFKTAYHHSHMMNESCMDFTSKNVGGDEGLKMYKDDKGFIDHVLNFLFSESSSAFQDRTALPMRENIMHALRRSCPSARCLGAQLKRLRPIATFATSLLTYMDHDNSLQGHQ